MTSTNTEGGSAMAVPITTEQAPRGYGGAKLKHALDHKRGQYLIADRNGRLMLVDPEWGIYGVDWE